MITYYFVVVCRSGLTDLSEFFILIEGVECMVFHSVSVASLYVALFVVMCPVMWPSCWHGVSCLRVLEYWDLARMIFSANQPVNMLFWSM